MSYFSDGFKLYGKFFAVTTDERHVGNQGVLQKQHARTVDLQKKI